MSIRIGVIGAGWVAQKHLEVIAANNRLKTAGIFSRTKLKAQQLANQFNIDVCADGMDDLVHKSKPDALLILVSEDQMYPVTKQAINYKLPLLIEKPAGLTPEENLDLSNLAKKQGVATMVAFNRRYYSIFHKGIEIIRNNGPLLGVSIEGHERIWKILELQQRFNRNILDHWIFANSTHTIDLLRLFGGEIRELATLQHSFKEPKGDQFAALMQLDNNAIGQYHAHWFSPGGWRVVLYGDGVTVEFKPLEQGRWIDKNFNTHEIIPDDIDLKYKPGFYAQMNSFADLVSDKKIRWPMLDLQGSYETMRLAAQISGYKGKTNV